METDGLVDAQRHPRIGVVAAGASRDRLGTRRHRTGARQVGDRLHATLVGADVQRDAAAELPSIGDLIGAVGGDVTRLVRERPTFRDCGHVEERVRRRCHG